MHLIRGLHNLKTLERGSVVTIGNFDGVHRGHQALITQLKSKAKMLGLPHVVIIFEPHPLEFFRKKILSPRLTILREKLLALKRYDVENVLVLYFNAELANLSAEEFIENILVKKLRIRHLIVGDDFRFGRERKGDFALLQQKGQSLGFVVTPMPTVVHDEIRISSQRLRETLMQSDLLLAKELLGRAYTICGRVKHGDKRGRIIGFPTANIALKRQASPLLGVYAVKVFGIQNKIVYGVANIGNRPTIDGTRCLLEVHLFDFNEDIYGARLEIEFIQKIRDEKKFENFELLKEQIFKDAEMAKEIISGSRNQVAG